MFRFNSRKIVRKTDDQGLTGMVIKLIENAENLLEKDVNQSHAYFLRAEEIHGNLCQATGHGFPEIGFRLDELDLAYRIKQEAEKSY